MCSHIGSSEVSALPVLGIGNTDKVAKRHSEPYPLGS